MKYFVIIDLQKDFVTGSLANPMAEEIIPNVVEMVKQKKSEGYTIVATRDTHSSNYLITSEGEKLPVIHCIEYSKGWEVVDELAPFIDLYVNKPTFGYLDWTEEFQGYPSDIELCGTVSEICVVSNALILKATYSESKIKVHKDLCAGLTKEAHEAAMKVMESCQIDIV